MKNTENLIKNIKDGKREHSSIPFWSWNDKLEKDILAEQIKDMADLGMRGFFMHARGGLETEYMSNEWFDAIRFCTEEAKKRGLEAWAYDENGWPSGFAGGELLKNEKNHACGLEYSVSDKYPDDLSNVLGIYVIDGQSIRFATKNDSTQLHIIRRIKDFSYVDTMNPEVTAKYIETTHERYRREVGEAMGVNMPGFFTDEPQYFRYNVPWSDTFTTTFKEAFGYDPMDRLPLLYLKLDGYMEFRYDYYLHCHRSFYLGFMKPIYEWCEANGVKLTGHAIEEWGLGWQMMCCGGVMPFYLYQHIPGVDYLHKAIKDISGAKQLGSVAEQMGKTTRLTESFASCGWGVSPRELKRIADLQFAGGVNLICEHLYAYSERGQRKRDYPNHYSEHSPWSKYFGIFENHYSNLGSALAQGKEIANVLVIHPIRSAYLTYRRNENGCISELEKKYSDFVLQFTKDHILYHFGDEGIIEDIGSVEGNIFRVGKCEYDTVVLPCCDTITSNTYALLREFLKNGGKLYINGESPTRIDGRLSDLSDLCSNISYEELCDRSGISIKHNGEATSVHAQLRQTDQGKLLFIANTTPNVYNDLEITLRGWSGVAELDVDDLKIKKIRGRRNADGSLTLLYNVGNSVSLLLVECEADMLDPLPTEKKTFKPLTGAYKLTSLPENSLTLDRARISRNQEEYSEEFPIMKIKDMLLSERFEGRLSLAFSFCSDIIPEKLIMVAEPMKYTAAKINGQNIEFTNDYRIDRRFISADISKHTRVGENVIELEFDYFQKDLVYKVLYGGGHESLRNCLSFDTEIEAIYLYGDFGVMSKSGLPEDERNTYRAKGDFSLVKRNDTIDISDIVKSGYPFFAGEMTIATTLTSPAEYIRISGKYSVCKLSVNGSTLPIDLFDNVYYVGDLMREGENMLELTVCFSNRNLLGPHHHVNPDPNASHPTLFSFEKAWRNGECADFKPEYSLVRVGAVIEVAE